MTRSTKFVATAAAGIAGLCVLLAVGGLVVARSDWFREQVRLRIVREVETATGGRAEIGGFSFDWSRMNAVVRRFVLHGTEGTGEPPLFSASSVELRLKVISAFRRDVDISSLTVAEPRVRVVVYENGRTNLPRPRAARARRNPIEHVLALEIGRFEVQKGILEIDHRQIPLDLRGENLSARWFYEAAGPRYSGDVSFRQLNVSYASYLPFAMDADLSLSLEKDRLTIRKGRLATGRSSTMVTGVVDNLLSPRAVFSLDGRFSLPEMQSIAKIRPVVQGSVAAKAELSIAGRSDYRMDGKVSGSGLSARLDGMEFRDLALTSNLELNPARIGLSGLSVSALGGVFTGEAGLERSGRFHVAGGLRDITLHGLARVRGIKVPPWDGAVSGPIQMDGSLSGGRASGMKVAGKFSIAPAGTGRPVSGFVDISMDQRSGTLALGDSSFVTPASRLRFRGDLDRRLQVELDTRDFDDLLPAAGYVSAAAPSRLPVMLRNGSARFTGTVTGSLADPRVAGHLSVKNLEYQQRIFDQVEADGTVTRTALQATRFLVTQAGASLEGEARAALREWRIEPDSKIAGTINLRGLSAARLVDESGSNFKLTGDLASSLQLRGTAAEPEIAGKASLTGGEALGQAIRQARTQFRYASGALSILSADVTWGAAQIQGSGRFAPKPDDWKSGALQFQISGKGVRLSDLRAPAGLAAELNGSINVDIRGSASITNARPLLSDLRGTALVSKLGLGNRVAGDLRLTARTEAGTAVISATGELIGAKVKAEATCLLQGQYAVQGELAFTRVSLESLRPWLQSQNGSDLPIEATGDGRIVFKGAGLNPDTWSGRLEMPAVEILPPSGTKTPVPGLRNAGVVVLALSRKEIRIIGAQFAGPDTNMRVTGRIDLATRFNAYDLRVKGGIDLAILRNLDPDITATGQTVLDATVRGPRSRPELYGRVDLQRVSLFLSGIPNGLEDVTGSVLLFRDRATIENLTAQTGGGRLTMNGFVGFGGDRLSYRLRAIVGRVRVRYPEGLSTSFDASLDLTGTSQRSLLSGTVTILRSGAAPDVDLASLLTRSSQPFVTPAFQNELLRGMQFDVRVETAPNARFETSLTRDIQAEAEMRLRGTAYRPVLLGRVLINQGEINFMGNRYTISRGEISFLNPVRLEPVVNLDLETRVRGIDVTMTFTGPMDRLNVAYRSDPPLQVQEIIALLAVGRAPTSDPALLAKQSERDQSWQQIGASTLVGQALAAPVADRLQRFFGVSRIKIDPKLTGLGNNPEAQLTLEQQVSKDITFTYVTNLAQEQQQLIRVEWNLNRQWSVLAVRQENGLFGVEFQYRKQFR